MNTGPKAKSKVEYADSALPFQYILRGMRTRVFAKGLKGTTAQINGPAVRQGRGFHARVRCDAPLAGEMVGGFYRKRKCALMVTRVPRPILPEISVAVGSTGSIGSFGSPITVVSCPGSRVY